MLFFVLINKQCYWLKNLGSGKDLLRPYDEQLIKPMTHNFSKLQALHRTQQLIPIFFPASLNHYTPAEDHQTKLERLTGGAITAAAADSKSNGDKTEIASKLPPSSHLHDALVKEEDENSSDNVEKPPKRRKIKREIIRPDPKYKGKSIKLRTSLSIKSR